MSIASMAAAYRLPLPPIQKFVAVTLGDQLDSDGYFRLEFVPQLCSILGMAENQLYNVVHALARRGLVTDGVDRDGEPAWFLERISEPYLRGQQLAKRKLTK